MTRHLPAASSTRWPVTAVTILAVLLCVDASVASSLRRSAIVRAVERARPSVVNIHGQKIVRSDQYSAEGTKRVNGMGTGVVIDGRGYILTNFHVVEGVKRIRVTLHNGHAYVARLIAHDPVTDLAIIKIPVKQRMPVVSVGNSQTILTGETVIAVGNAYGYEHTVTTGIVSAQHRNVAVNDTQSYKDLIQTDASINPGNSGGPLLNIDGEMIGINVAVRVGAQGIGFAIPVNKGMQIAARLMSVERLSGLWHGVIHEDAIVDDEAQVVVRDVQAGSPAYQAGVRQGDVILQVGGKPIGRGVELECALIDSQQGESVPFAIRRANREVDLQVDLVARPAKGRRQKANKVSTESGEACPHLGIRVHPITTTEMKRISDKFRGGLRVLSVGSTSLAAKQGLRNGDALVGVHIWETISMDNLSYVLNEADFGEAKTVPFYIIRNGKTMSGSFTVATLQAK